MTHNFTEEAYWNTRFQQEEHAYGEDPNDFLRENMALFKKGDQVLSLAEGEGRNAVFLAQHQCMVRGVDFSSTGRKKALELARKRRVEIDYDLADLTAYDMGENRWDGIVSVFCHVSKQHRPAFFEAIKRALKPRGIFLMECYNKKQLAFDSGGPKALSHLPSLEELNDVFVDFQVVLAQDIERYIQEGSLHDGQSSVTQIIVRKKP